MKTEDIDEAILASLKKLGPSAPRRLADDAGIDPGAVTYAGVRLRKARLIQTAGTTLNRLWALPEQKIELADLLTGERKKAKKAKAAAKPKKTAKRTYTRRKTWKGGTPAQARKAVARKLRRTEGRADEAAGHVLHLDAADDPMASTAAREIALAVNDAMKSVSRLRAAFNDHLAAVHIARQQVFGVIAGDLAPVEI